ncbi:MAG: alanine racemase [Gammaproteobacteria bacterium]|nr:alanine racemase [Gammaproteobacteria bacterium]
MAPEILIDTDALLANLQRIKQIVGTARVMPVVKSDAYGHGVDTVVNTIGNHVEALAVLRLNEALQIRELGFDKTILVMGGVISAEEMTLAAENSLDWALHSLEQVEFIENNPTVAPSIWLKLETGMNRLGVHADNLESVIARLNDCDNVAKPWRWMTHIACADTPGHPLNQLQLDNFARLTEGQEGERSVANSASLFAFPKSYYDWVRPGLALYGVSPVKGQTAADLGLRPAMSVWTTVRSVKSISVGQTVGYGAFWTAERDTRIGIIDVGYSDGYPFDRYPSMSVAWEDHYIPVVGHVSMGMLAIDTDDHDVKMGDRVEIWGHKIAVEAVSESVNTIPYDLLTSFNKLHNRQAITPSEQQKKAG